MNHIDSWKIGGQGLSAFFMGMGRNAHFLLTLLMSIVFFWKSYAFNHIGRS